MKLPSPAILISALALFTSCANEPAKNGRAQLSAARLNSTVKGVLLEKLGAYQSKADGLYEVSDGILRVGAHAVDLRPVVESESSKQGKSIVAMRIEVALDGVSRSEAVFGAIGIAGTQEEAISVGLGEWYVGFAVPLFQAIGERNSSLAIGDYDVFAGTLGLRGSAALNWMDGSEAMHRKILDVVWPAVPRRADFVVLDLKVMASPTGPAQSACRINSVLSTEMASRLIALDWPRTAEGYLFKQAFVLKRRKPNKLERQLPR